MSTSAEPKPSETNLSTNPSMIATGNDHPSLLDLSTGYIVLVVGGGVFLFLLLIFALYKYRNRDEGTYTIDETKNYGPFAELDAPLNGSKATKKSSKNRRKGLSDKNKEWYV